MFYYTIRVIICCSDDRIQQNVTGFSIIHVCMVWRDAKQEAATWIQRTAIRNSGLFIALSNAA